MSYDIILGRSDKEKEQFGTRGTVFIGKHYVTMGKTVSLANPIKLDVVKPHVVLICGKRGGGKCLSGDTLITLNDGSLVPIRDLEKNDNEILSLDGNLKIGNALKTGFYKRKVGKLLRITSRTGKTIKLTPEHPLLTVSGWLPAEQLKTGSRIATPRVIDAFGEDDLEECKVKILAYLVAEDHLSNRFVLFANTDEKISSDFNQAIKDFDSDLKIKEHGKPNCFRIVQNKRRVVKKAVRNKNGKFKEGTEFDSKSSIRKWLDELGIYGKLSAEKHLPSQILNLPKHKLSLFLNRLFSCDGSIYKEGSNYWKISYSSSSEQLIREVQHLILRFGIVGMVRRKKIRCGQKKFDNYELELKGPFVSKFLQEIGFYGDKEVRQRLALKECESILRNPNLDTIPKEIWELYRPDNWAKVGNAIGYSTPKALRSSINYSPSRQKLAQIAQIDGDESIMKLAESDIYWDEIMRVEELYGDFEVYDITVPKTHNFVANDIIVHNSYTMAVMAEGMAMMDEEVRDNLSCLFVDTMGIYWTSKYPNFRDEKILDEWDMEPEGFTDNTVVFVPGGVFEAMKERGVPVDQPYSVSASELGAFEWCSLLNVSPVEPIGIVISRSISNLLQETREFGIKDMIKAIQSDPKADNKTKEGAVNLFEAVDSWGLFTAKGTPIGDLIQRGKISILDVSYYAHHGTGFSIRAMVIGLLARTVLRERMAARKIEELAAIGKGWRKFKHDYDKESKQQVPLVWMFIDEAHEFLPRDGETLASNPLVQLLREGRQPGISLVLATQQPGKIHTDAMTQCDIVISHRLTSKLDIDALNNIMHSYLPYAMQKYLDELPRKAGSAIVLDDKQEKMYPIQIRPRVTWHGGEAPSAMPPEGKGVLEEEDNPEG